MASGRGAAAIVAGAATGTGRPIPRAVDFAAGSVTVTPVEADGSMVVVDVALKEAVALTAVADVPTVEEVVASVEADVVTAEGDTPMAVAEDMASVEAGIASVEVVPTVVGAGRSIMNSMLSRPTALAVGRRVFEAAFVRGPAFCRTREGW